MYTGFKPNSSVSKTIVSSLGETQLQTLQRQVDNYTRKLQQEKKKYFSVQDTYKIVTEEYEKQKTRLNQLKKQSTKAQNIIAQSKIKNLEADLQKAISIYDDTMSQNQKLKNEINMLRRQKKNFHQTQKTIKQQIEKYENDTAQKMRQIEKKKAKAEQLKKQIMQIKHKNQQERDQYIRQFDSLERQYMEQKRQRQVVKFEKSQKPEAVDTQPLLKFRLKNLIKSNKTKLRMIQQYKKQMKMIQQAFNQIKQKSGISDLNQITQKFIKSQEQNYSLYNYMDSLSRNIDALEKANSQLQQDIKAQEKQEIERKKYLQQTPEDEQKKKQLQYYVKKKQEANKDLSFLVQQIKPILKDTLLQLADSPLNQNPNKAIEYKLSLDINERTVQGYLSELQKYVNNLLIIKKQAKLKVTNNIKQSVTAYSKPLPQFNADEVKMYDKKQRNDRERSQQRNEVPLEIGQKFMDQSKFREYAIQYWQKKKNKGRQ